MMQFLRLRRFVDHNSFAYILENIFQTFPLIVVRDTVLCPICVPKNHNSSKCNHVIVPTDKLGRNIIFFCPRTSHFQLTSLFLMKTYLDPQGLLSLQCDLLGIQNVKLEQKDHILFLYVCLLQPLLSLPLNMSSHNSNEFEISLIKILISSAQYFVAPLTHCLFSMPTSAILSILETQSLHCSHTILNPFISVTQDTIFI